MGYPVDLQNATYTHAVVITPSDSALLDPVPRALYIDDVTSGTTVTIVTPNGEQVQFNVSAGDILPVAAEKVLEAGTLADTIIGLW